MNIKKLITICTLALMVACGDAQESKEAIVYQESFEATGTALEVTTTGVGSEVTIAYWVSIDKISQPANKNPIYLSLGAGLHIQCDDSQDGMCSFHNGTFYEAELFPTDELADGQYHHIAISVNADGATIYLNGDVVDTNESQSFCGTSGDCNFIFGQGFKPNQTHGSYEGISVYAYALDQDEVRGLLNR